MSLSDTPDFEVPDLSMDPIEEGTSILLTGDDADALETVFYRLMSPTADESALVLATDADGRVVERRVDVDPWLNGERSVTISLEPGTLRRVTLDPDGVFPDLNRGNDTWTAGEEDGRARP